MTSLVKHRKTYQGFLKLCDFWEQRLFTEHFLYLTSPIHWGIWGWCHYRMQTFAPQRKVSTATLLLGGLRNMKGTLLLCGHHGQVIVVMTIYCKTENYPLQLCNSEDFVKFEGLSFIVVIIVTLLMFRLLGLSRTWWIIFDSSLNRYARNLPVSQQCLQIKCKLCQLIDVVSLWNTSSTL